MKQDPIAYLKSRFGTQFHFRYMPNGGNLGDNLIAAATVQALDASGLDWEFFRDDERGNTDDRRVFIYGGGGSLVDLYAGGINCIKHLMKFSRPIVVLPQTIRGHSDFWSHAPNITVFARDLQSYEYALKFPQLTCLPADDMATNFNMLEPAFAAIRRYHHSMTATAPISIALNAFREDDESRREPDRIRGCSIDLSNLMHPTLKNRADIYTAAVLFLMSVSGFRLVRTDRLHVSVAAALVGASVELFDNSYGKNQAVFDFTLRQRFPNIRFMGVK
ncbi:polysaccharide pyruvyl transferase family protein [Microvirga arabica]|uniref:polysaccharide pyruvyl transferase family protein n=1 Tax=Microvirga arabica TaxID=1128671 RepID=UPI001939A502|nr:polysaccharide pyruvyl transferase family protein [Microvirga arabica]MBM1171282.1 hypothetical protein [Microvirga arabica]